MGSGEADACALRFDLRVGVDCSESASDSSRSATAGERSFVGNDHPPKPPQDAANPRDAQKVEPRGLPTVVGHPSPMHENRAAQQNQRSAQNPFQSFAQSISPGGSSDLALAPSVDRGYQHFGASLQKHRPGSGDGGAPGIRRSAP